MALTSGINTGILWYYNQYTKGKSMPYKDAEVQKQKCKERYLKHKTCQSRDEYISKVMKPLTNWTCAEVDKVKRARKLIHRAVRKKRLLKPKRCEKCDTPTSPMNLHAHHKNYDVWQDIDWLCTFCHKLEHRRSGNDKRPRIKSNKRQDFNNP